MSAIVFACPHCAENLEYSEDAPGSKVRCPSCKRLVRVPEEEDSKGSWLRSLRSSFQTTTLIMGLLLLAAALIAAIIGLIELKKNPEPIRRLLGRLGEFLTDSLSTAGTTLSLIAMVLAALIVIVVVAGWHAPT